LEESSLVNDTDAWAENDDRVTMMTLHASKGLEFPVVFIIALEEGLLPHERSREQPEQLEEERRLLFVGMTRAEQELELSLASYREFRGQRRMSVPSQFLMELPRHEMRYIEPKYTPMDWREDQADVHELADESGDISFDFADDRPAVQTQDPPSASSPKLVTAAELHGRAASTAPAISPDAFHQGMLVRHPEYGLGKIVALSGSGSRRTATVAFVSGAGQKRFMLAQSPLRPANGG
jgi:DNA helicase-2/ATP-dependent DNA helicase PcrA